MGVNCCVCLNLSGDRVAAVTVIGGYAVCQQHVELASKPGFDLWSLHAGERRKIT